MKKSCSEANLKPTGLCCEYLENPIGFPGYKKFIIRPQIPDEIQFAKTKIQSLYGSIEAEWKADFQTGNLSVKIPFNTQAEIFLPLV